MAEAMNTQMHNEEEVQQDVSRLTVKRVPETDMKNATYSFVDEDHTLGNLLRNQIVKNKHVEFTAYSVPHPSEHLCNVRIECNDNETVDVDSNQEFAAKYGVRNIPTVLVFKGGEVVEKQVGVAPKATYAQKIDAHL